MSARPTTYNTILERLQKNRHEDTIQMGREVERLLEHPGWGRVQEFLEVMIADIDRSMEFGLHDHVGYVSFVAERRALRTAQVIAEAIVEGARRAEQQVLEMASQMEAEGSA